MRITASSMIRFEGLIEIIYRILDNLFRDFRLNLGVPLELHHAHNDRYPCWFWFAGKPTKIRRVLMRAHALPQVVFCQQGCFADLVCQVGGSQSQARCVDTTRSQTWVSSESTYPRVTCHTCGQGESFTFAQSMC